MLIKHLATVKAEPVGSIIGAILTVLIAAWWVDFIFHLVVR